MDISYLGDRWLAVVAAVVLLHTSSANGQAGGSYDVRRSAIEGGGVTVASGGSYRIGGTIGQPVAGTASGGSHFLGAGFWGGAGGMPAPTVTVTVRITPMATVSPLSTGTATAVPTVPSGTPTPSPTVIAATSTPNGSPAASPIPSTAATTTGTRTAPTPTPTPPPFGDGNCDGRVGAADLVALVELIARAESGACGGADSNGDGRVDAEDIDATIELIF